MHPTKEMSVAVVIPCYKVSKTLSDLLKSFDNKIKFIYCIDDACPESSYKIAESCATNDNRIKVIRHDENEGVGGAMVSGYKRALLDGADIIVKVDGDGQMNPSEIERLIRPIVSGVADYTKGNRFYNLNSLSSMPKVRLYGNVALSFLSKLSTGYWHIFDPTNGFTAIHSKVLGIMPLEKINKRYFFETDIMFNLNILNAAIMDIPMEAKYEDEESSMRIKDILVSFPFLHLKILSKRLFYNYFLRNFSIASINLIFGLISIFYGILYGFMHLPDGGENAPAGVVMMAALPIIVGVQLLLSFINYDMTSREITPLYLKL